MAMERVTVEQNGERFTLEVPEGTSDDEIRSFLESQQSVSSPTAGPEPATQVGTYAAQAAAPMAANLASAGINKALQMPLTSLTNPIAHPISTAMKVAQAVGNAVPQVPTQVPGPNASLVTEMPGTRPMNVGEGLKSAGKGLLGGARALGAGLAQGAMAPENMFTLPYQMAAYEQAKIRQNPNAPGLEYNPYAQTVRGEASTQGRAGAANQMRTVANMPYGNVTPQERQMLEEDARMRNAVRKKAFEKVMGPVVPGSF